MLLVGTRDQVAVRDTLWKALVRVKAENTRLIVSENLETTSGDLYAFGPSLRAAFAVSLSGLKELDYAVFQSLLASTQQVVLNLCDEEHRSAQLGNALREAAGKLSVEYAAGAREIIDSLKTSVEEALGAKDSELPNKLGKVSPRQPPEIPPHLLRYGVEERADPTQWRISSDLLGAVSSSPRLKPISCRVMLHRYDLYWGLPTILSRASKTREAPPLEPDTFNSVQTGDDRGFCIPTASYAGNPASKGLWERVQRQKEKTSQRSLAAKLNTKPSNPCPAPDRKRRGR